MKKPPRAVRLRRAKTRIHQLWSRLVRRRDGYRCVLCGVTEALQAHHWIVHAGSSLGTRFLIDNGVTLCYACHIFKVHGRGDALFLDQLKEYMRHHITEERYEEIKGLGRQPVNFSLEDLEMIEAHLTELLTATQSVTVTQEAYHAGEEAV